MAFVLVAGFACLVMVNGLRAEVAEVFVSAGAPRQLITVIAPDMVLGKSLSDAPKVQARPETSGEVPSTGSTPAVGSGATTSVSATSAAPASTSKSVKHRSRAHASSASPVKPPVKAPVKAPVVTPVKAPVAAPVQVPAKPKIAKPDKPVSPGKLGGGSVGWAPSDDNVTKDRDTRRGGDRHWKSSSSAPKKSDDRSVDRGHQHGWSGSSGHGSDRAHDHDHDHEHGHDDGDHDRGSSRGDQGHSHHGH